MSQKADVEKSGIRIASYNTHGGVGRDRHFVPKRIADVLREIDADVVALQELENRATGFDMSPASAETGMQRKRGASGVRHSAKSSNSSRTRSKAARS